MPENSNKKKLIAGAISLAIFVVLVIIFSMYRTSTDVTTPKSEIDTFQGVSLSAKSVYVMDLKKNKVIFEKNAEMQLPLASLTKIMSSIVAIDEAAPDMKIKIADTLLVERGGGDIYANEEWRLRDLIDFALVTSSNDAAEAIASAVGSLQTTEEKSAEEIFVDKMNEKARKLGLSQTYFVNPSGLDISETFSGAYGSARDAAKLISHAYLMYPNVTEATARKDFTVQSLSGLVHNVSNTNEIADTLPGLLASKTGFTDLAGGNLAVVLEAGPGRPIAIAVMGSTKDGRFEDVMTLYQAALKYINSNYE